MLGHPQGGAPTSEIVCQTLNGYTVNIGESGLPYGTIFVMSGKISKFANQVYELTRNIPKGKVATYGQLAAVSGSQGAARAVGMLMKKNPDAPNTPCHRVVAADGSLTGYSGGGVKVKKRMLLAEGVVFKGERVDLRVSGIKKL